MTQVTYTTESLQDETSFPCNCCGRPIHEAAGWLRENGDEIACYQYRWSEGHDAAFSMAVAGTTGDVMRPGHVTVSAHWNDGRLRFSVLEPGASAWDDSDDFGPVQSPERALDPSGLYPDLWTLVDAITRAEPRLAERIGALDRS